jgi:hypothetical protein
LRPLVPYNKTSTLLKPNITGDSISEQKSNLNSIHYLSFQTICSMLFKSSSITLLIVSFFFFSSCNQNAATNKSAADPIYINAVIWKGDSANAKATAIAIKDSLIV